MNFWSPMRSISLGVLLCCGVAAPTVAQTSPVALPSVQSSGLTVRISNIILSQQNISIQFVAKNNTKARVYLRDSLEDKNQFAFLGSGEQVYYPKSVVGIETCDGNVDQCNNSSGAQDLNDYSYLDPGEKSSFMFVYQASNPVNENDTLTFSVVLIAKFSVPDSDPTQAGDAQAVRFNFSTTQLN